MHTNQWSEENSYVTADGKEAERPRLRLCSTDFRNHCSNCPRIKSVPDSEKQKRPLCTDTILPAKSPAQQRNSIICHTLLLNPKIEIAMVTPLSEKTSTGLRPRRSEALP